MKKTKNLNYPVILLIMALCGVLSSAVVSALTVLILLSLMVVGTVIALLLEALWVALILVAKKKLGEKRNISSLASAITLAGVPTVVWGIVFGIVMYLDSTGAFAHSGSPISVNATALFLVIWSMAGVICSLIALISVFLYCIVEYVRLQNKGGML